jgi:hypothetical protein
MISAVIVVRRVRSGYVTLLRTTRGGGRARADRDICLGLSQILDIHMPHLRRPTSWSRRARLLRPLHQHGRLQAS